DKGCYQNEARCSEDDLESMVAQPMAEVTLQAKQQDEKKASYHGRHGKRQVDEDKQDRPAREAKPSNGPSRGNSEYKVAQNGQRRYRQCEQDGMARERIADQSVKIRLYPCGKSLIEDVNHRHDHQDGKDSDGCQSQRPAYPPRIMANRPSWFRRRNARCSPF